jgi:hypothetical protein
LTWPAGAEPYPPAAAAIWPDGASPVAGDGGPAVETFDSTRPNIARVWDYWLGGKDNFAADRELAEQMLEVYPLAAQMARP